MLKQEPNNTLTHTHTHTHRTVMHAKTGARQHKYSEMNVTENRIEWGTEKKHNKYQKHTHTCTRTHTVLTINKHTHTNTYTSLMHLYQVRVGSHTSEANTHNVGGPTIDYITQSPLITLI